MLATQTLKGGFATPVLESQQLFRAVMDGFASPGSLAAAGPKVQPPAPLGVAAGAVLLTLCDFETNVWLSNSLRGNDVRGWLNFHAGAPVVENERDAAFAFAASSAELPPLIAFAVGNDEYPDTSTTLILEVTAFEGGPALVLEGPGINGSTTMTVLGLPKDFLAAWEMNGTLFPCGIDLVLTAGERFLCLPRTTRIKEA